MRPAGGRWRSPPQGASTAPPARARRGRAAGLPAGGAGVRRDRRPDVGLALLQEHRAGLELLRLALRGVRLAVRRRASRRSARCCRARRRRTRRRPGRSPAPARRGRPSGSSRLRASPPPTRLLPDGGAAMSVDVLLWGVLPYVAIVVLVGGTVWRCRYDQFGWTTRSSQLYESRLLRHRQPAVPLRHPRRAHRPRHRPGGPGVVDGRGRAVARRPTTSRRSLLGGVAGLCHARRRRDPDLPPAHDRAGVHGDHPERQGHVRRPRRGDRRRPRHHAARRRRDR